MLRGAPEPHEVLSKITLRLGPAYRVAFLFRQRGLYIPVCLRLDAARSAASAKHSSAKNPLRAHSNRYILRVTSRSRCLVSRVRKLDAAKSGFRGNAILVTYWGRASWGSGPWKSVGESHKTRPREGVKTQLVSPPRRQVGGLPRRVDRPPHPSSSISPLTRAMSLIIARTQW